MTWQPFSEIPDEGEFLVYLEAPMLNTRFHTMWRHPNETFIGGRFSYNCPKVTHFMALPAPPEVP